MHAESIGPELLAAIKNAPLLSPNALQLLQVSARKDHDLDEVIRLVKYDSALTARILRVVNSAAYGLTNPVNSIERAVMYLGERLIVGIAISDCTAKLFLKPMEGYEGDRGSLWRHDLFTAIASRQVASFARTPFDLDLAFTAGLLHDIGKSILSDFLKGTAAAFSQRIEAGEVDSYLAAEQDLLGHDHCAVGCEVARNWGLPEALQAGIRYHHHPADAPEPLRPLAYSIHLGDMLAMMSGQDTGSDGMKYPLDPNYGEYFDISSESLALTLLEVEEDFRKVHASLS